MSDLGAIFHVKKGGAQYDAHAYTTLNECPEPNLKLTYKGQQGYVKLVAKGSGDVPCYVKTKAGNTYQVIKEAVPSGSTTINCPDYANFTVPKMVNVIKVAATSSESAKYIGVTPNATYTIAFTRIGLNKRWKMIHKKGEDSEGGDYGIEWQRTYERGQYATLSWSSEINKQTPTITDY